MQYLPDTLLQPTVKNATFVHPLRLHAKRLPMRSASPPIFVAILGWIVIISIPTMFFVFGWKNFDIYCQRQI
ncbi:MAG: hypothetical protein ACTS8S_18115, partial [Giesbergeria sp.]